MESMGLRSAMMFAAFDRRCANLPAGEDAARIKNLSKLVSELVFFETSRIRRFDPRANERTLRRSVEGGLRYVMATGASGYQAKLADLEELARRVTGKSNVELRDADQAPGQYTRLPARSIPAALGRLFDWLQSPAFAEMHPVEQMTVCQARLHEIAPFAALSETVTSCFSYFFPWSRFGLLPLYEMHELSALYAALGDAVSLQTGPLVEINLKACQKACSLLTERP
jgi:hypothetical protein